MGKDVLGQQSRKTRDNSSPERDRPIPRPVDDLVTDDPAAFMPVKSPWGLRGSARVHLENSDEPTLRRAIATAWRKAAPKRLSAKTRKQR